MSRDSDGESEHGSSSADGEDANACASRGHAQSGDWRVVNGVVDTHSHDALHHTRAPLDEAIDRENAPDHQSLDHSQGGHNPKELGLNLNMRTPRDARGETPHWFSQLRNPFFASAKKIAMRTPTDTRHRVVHVGRDGEDRARTLKAEAAVRDQPLETATQGRASLMASPVKASKFMIHDLKAKEAHRVEAA